MKRKLILTVSTALAVLTFGCSLFTGASPTPAAPANTPAQPDSGPVIEPTSSPVSPTAQPSAADPAPPQAVLDLDTLKNFTYTLEYGPDSQVPLSDGVYDLPSDDPNLQLHSQLIEPAAFGDLNGDGADDAAVGIASNTGGTGVFVHLVAVLNTDQGPVQAAEIFIDDRAVIQDLRIEDGRILLDVLGHGPDDPGCCPSQHKIVTFELSGAELVVVDEQVLP